MKNLKGYYNSTNGFVNQNNLHVEAEALWGKDWEPESDVEQIQELITSLGRKDLRVKFIEGKEEDDIRVCKRKINFSKKQLVEVLRQTFLAGNNFGAENHNNDNDEDYNLAEKNSIDSVIK
jgi:hypothetical protein